MQRVGVLLQKTRYINSLLLLLLLLFIAMPLPAPEILFCFTSSLRYEMRWLRNCYSGVSFWCLCGYKQNGHVGIFMGILL